jgi:hypothetical protein
MEKRYSTISTEQKQNKQLLLRFSPSCIVKPSLKTHGTLLRFQCPFVFLKYVLASSQMTFHIACFLIYRNPLQKKKINDLLSRVLSVENQNAARLCMKQRYLEVDQGNVSVCRCVAPLTHQACPACHDSNSSPSLERLAIAHTACHGSPPVTN